MTKRDKSQIAKKAASLAKGLAIAVCEYMFALQMASTAIGVVVCWIMTGIAVDYILLMNAEDEDGRKMDLGFFPTTASLGEEEGRIANTLKRMRDKHWCSVCILTMLGAIGLKALHCYAG